MISVPLILCLILYIVKPTHCFVVERQPKPPDNLEKAFNYDIPLDQAGRLHLYWDTIFKTEDVYFHLTAKLNDGEWLGFGFSDYGENVNADLVLFWRNQQGVFEFEDAWTDDTATIHLDKEQNYELLGKEKKGDLTKFTFKRKFVTCDKKDYAIDNGTTHIIYFIGTDNTNQFTPVGNSLNNYDVGIQRTQLIKSQVELPTLPYDVRIFEIRVKNLHVPATDTTYWCETHRLPKIDRKGLIVRYEGVITKGHETLVHHMEVFHCEAPPDAKIKNYSGPCPDEGTMMKNGPSPLGVCKRVIGAWAMGAPPMVYPKEAGVPIGGPKDSSYVVVQVHYNNPNMMAGLVDNSGIRFYFTHEFRPFEAGIMELGLEYTPKNSIPPQMDRFSLTGDCISECTRIGLNAGVMIIFASQLHTHTSGIQVYTKHIRNGVELPEINRDDHYSPHFQEIRLLSAPIHVLPGDALRTTCTYRTKGRKEITLGGFSIRDEMCVNYVHYYPKHTLEVCKSSVDTDVLNGFFKFMYDYDLDATSSKHSVEKNYRSIRWTPLTAHLLNNLYNENTLSMQCNKSSGTRYPGNWENMQQTKILYPLKVDEKCAKCNQAE